MSKVFEWLFSGPKIIGQVEQQLTGNAVKDAKHLGALTMMQIYVVNKRVQPITIKGMFVWVKIGGTWVKRFFQVTVLRQMG